MRHPEFSPFPTDEYVARVQKAREEITTAGIDALVVTAKENVVYFSGLQTIGWISKHRPLGVIIPRDDSWPPMMVLPETLVDVALETSWIDELRPWGGWRRKDAAPDPIIGMQRALAEMGLEEATLGFELGYGQRVGMSQVDYDRLVSSLPLASVVDGSPVLWKLRMIKSDLEIEAIGVACAATTKAFEEGFTALKEGMSEAELAGIMLGRMASETNEVPGFMMVRSGKRKYGMVNVLPFDKPMVRGDLVVADAGARYKDYWADYMRMACIGEPSADQRRFFEADYESQKAGVRAIKPGATTGDVFAACYDVLVDHGLKEHATLERVGHGLGLDPHESPSIERGGSVVLQPGMVLTVEPIFSDLPDYQIGNFAIEDVVVVTDTGNEVLSHFPTELFVVPTT